MIENQQIITHRWEHAQDFSTKAKRFTRRPSYENDVENSRVSEKF